MATYQIILNGQTYGLSTVDAAQIAAISACRARVNASMPQTVKDGENDIPNPDLLADDTAFLQRAFDAWATTNPGFSSSDVATTADRAFASYAGQPPPVVTPPPLTGEALKASLRTYASVKHKSVLEAGVTINGVIVSTDTRGCVDMAGAVALAQLVPSHVFDWVCTTGPVQLTAQQVIDLGTAVGLHIQGTYAQYGAVINQINGGTITTTEQVDQSF